jgi:hypothetical protein
LGQWVETQIKFLEMGPDDLAVVITDLGTPLFEAVAHPVLHSINSADIYSAVCGIIPHSNSQGYADAESDHEYLGGACHYYLGVPLDEAMKGPDTPSEAAALELAVEYACHATELLVNTMMDGIQKVSDPTAVTKKLMDCTGEGLFNSDLLVGQGTDAASAFGMAVEGHDGNAEVPILSVTGCLSSIESVVELAQKRFPVGIWVSRRVVGSELVRVTLVV